MPRISALLMLLLVLGCGDGYQRLDWLPRAVVGGMPATDDPGVVLVVIPGGAGCTGTAISRRVVLTAKHCTQGTEASEWRVLVGMAPLTLEEREAEYLVSEIREAPGGTGVGEDLAVMLLDSDFEFTTYRYAFTGLASVEVGAPVRHVGFGMTEAGVGSTAGSRNMRSGSLSEVYSQSLNAVVGACSGDSGGPLFDADDTVLGVAHDILDANCDGQARFTRLEHWADLIASALTDTGGCVPEAWTDTCGDGVDNDCNGITDDGCDPVDAGTDAGTDTGSDAGVETDAGTHDGAANNADGADGDQKPTGKVKGTCSTGGTPSFFGSLLGLLSLAALLNHGRSKKRPA